MSLLTGNRKVAPFGLSGGVDGACGANNLIRAEGVEQPLGGCAVLDLQSGDRVRIATPGGGGFGLP